MSPSMGPGPWFACKQIALKTFLGPYVPCFWNGEVGSVIPVDPEIS